MKRADKSRKVVLSFFHVGPPKTATTWLHTALQEKVVLPGPIKETEFFNRHYQNGIDWYLRHFHPAHSGLPCGEIAPEYFSSADSTWRLKDAFPNARIICTFRDPVDRLYSCYKFQARFGDFLFSFEDALAIVPNLYSSALYATHLKRWQQTFGPENVLVTFYEDVRVAPQQFLDEICDFIGLARFELKAHESKPIMAGTHYKLPRVRFVTRIGARASAQLQKTGAESLASLLKRIGVGKLFFDNGKEFAPVKPETEAALRQKLSPEIEELERITGRDLSAWKPPADRRHLITAMADYQ
jgi:Sulfotransferase domain